MGADGLCITFHRVCAGKAVLWPPALLVAPTSADTSASVPHAAALAEHVGSKAFLFLPGCKAITWHRWHLTHVFFAFPAHDYPSRAAVQVHTARVPEVQDIRDRHLSSSSSSSSSGRGSKDESSSQDTPLLFTTSVEGSRVWKAAKSALQNASFEAACIELLAPYGHQYQMRVDQHGAFPDPAFQSKLSGGPDAAIQWSEFDASMLPEPWKLHQLEVLMQCMLDEAGGILLPASAFRGSQQLHVFLTCLHKVRAGLGKHCEGGCASDYCEAANWLICPNRIWRGCGLGHASTWYMQFRQY